MALTFADAIDKVCDERRTRQDFLIPLEQFSLSLDADGQNIVGTIDGNDYVPTEHCLKQMANVMDVSHAVLKQYLTNPTKLRRKKGVEYEVDKYKRDRTDRELLLALFKNGIRDGRVDPKKMFRFRTYTDGTLRAMLTERYAIIDNVWYIEQLQKFFVNESEQPVFEHFRGDADTIYGDLRIPSVSHTGNDSDYGGMLFIGNCEIGTRRLSIAEAVWRQICTNGMMGWAAGNAWSKVHRGDIDLHGLAASIAAKIGNAIPMLREGIDKFLATQQLELVARPSEVIAQIAKEQNLSVGRNGQALAVMEEYATHEQGFKNLFGIVNAITRAAQLQEADEQFRLEGLGGLLTSMDSREWARLNAAAASMKVEERNKIYGRVAA